MKSRKEMNPEFTWDFTHIYADNKAWEAALAEADKIADTIPALKGTLGESAESLRNAMDLLAKANQAAELPYIYAMLYKSADNGDNEAQEMEAKAMTLLVKLGTVCSFIEPEILAIPEETLKQYMEYEGLATYRHMLEDISRGRAHVLDEKSEMLLAKMGDITRV
ncbi:MAG: oligoendopeptidase F, partial [Clostridia bacterium]|nr:oligoendopeptidase F [Clostridia bacterium]